MEHQMQTNERQVVASRGKAKDTHRIVVANEAQMGEELRLRGRFKTSLTAPSKDDLSGLLRLRELTNRLFMQAMREKNQAARIELFAQRDELLDELASIPQILLAEDEFSNLVTTVGKNYALDGYLQTAVTIVGPYMGLIGAVSYTTGPAAGDTMTSHAGWTEAGATNAPTYTAPRKTCAWSAAAGGSKALSAALTFAITGTGTVKGCFINLSTGAVSTIDNTAGTLYSAGLFTGGDQPVVNGNTLNVSYTASL